MSREWQAAMKQGLLKEWQLYDSHVREYENRLAVEPFNGVVLTWERLQQIKNEIWGAATFAVEVFPNERDVVNLYPTRHLWRFKEGALEWAVRDCCMHREFVEARRIRDARREGTAHQDC